MRANWKSWLRKTGISLSILLGVMVVSYFGFQRESLVLNAQIRAQFGGEYARLPDGVTHYELLGNGNGPLVVMLHGSTVSIWDFDLQVDSLLNAGFRVLRFDALGRGLSDRPQIDYTRDLYVSQVKDLLNWLKVEEPVFLLGHSLGGAIAVQFAAENPEMVRGIALLSPVVNSVHARAPFWICNTPLLGDFLLRVAMIKVLHVRANEQWAGTGVNMEHYSDLFARQASIAGFEHAVCSMFTTDMVGDYRDAYRQVGELNIPGWLVYGGEDTAVWPDDVNALKPMMPDVEFRYFPHGAHSIHVQSRDIYNRELIQFLRKH